MKATRTCLTVLALILGAPSTLAAADDWKPVARDQDMVLAYQATGNLVRLRFTNTGRAPMTVNWTLQVQLVTGKNVDNRGELTLDGGETEVVASTPYLDAGHPAEVRNVTGTITAKQVAR